MTDAGSIKEHMDVIASDGETIGRVDHVEGADKIKLTKSDSPDGKHHFVPFSWIAKVDQHVHLSKSANDIQKAWESEAA